MSARDGHAGDDWAHRGSPWPPGRVAIALVALLGALLAAGAILVVRHGFGPGVAAAAPPVPAGPALDPPKPAQALVFVSGAVAQPGLYSLPATARVADALAAAGGVTVDADTGRLPDLAQRVTDGKQVNIPVRRSTAGSGASTGVARVDVNSATVEELRAIPTMPLGLAEAIVDARTTFGPFQSLSQLKSTLGLDSQTFVALRPYLRAGTSTR